MKIKNRTHYDTALLHAIFTECKKITGVYVDNVSVIYHITLFGKCPKWISAYAYVGGSKIVIKLPKRKEWALNSNIGQLEYKSQALATVAIHELGHLIKVPHNCGLTFEHLFIDKIKETFNDESFPVK
jgi:hypothetical protein